MLSLIPNHYPESQNINCYIMCYVETSPWDRFLPVVGRKTLGRFSVLPSCQDSKVLYVQWSGTTQNIPCTIRNSLLHLVSPATENKSLRALLCNPLGQLTTGAGGGGDGILKFGVCYLQASSRYVPEQKRALQQVQWFVPRAQHIHGAGGGVAAQSPGAPEESCLATPGFQQPGRGWPSEGSSGVSTAHHGVVLGQCLSLCRLPHSGCRGPIEVSF